MTKTWTIKTRSKAPYALVVIDRASEPQGWPPRRPAIGAQLVGYAHSQSHAVQLRARRLNARILPIENGQVTVKVEEGS